MIIGQRGTGKTHGIVNEIETQLSINHHVLVLIQARIFTEQDTWKKNLVDVLGLSDSWSEEEIWSALEAISYRHEINSPFDIETEDSIRIIPKVIIYIDGIDEMKPYSQWNERISEASVIIKNHPRLRFCFTGRKYAFTDKSLLNGYNYKKNIYLMMEMCL